MLCVEDLAKLDLFQQLPPARLEWVCDRARKIKALGTCKKIRSHLF